MRFKQRYTALAQCVGLTMAILACAPAAVAADGAATGATARPYDQTRVQVAQASPPARPAGANQQAELDTLIKAAKAENAVTFYSAATENVAKKIADGFTAKYGIKAQYIRLGSAAQQQRYAAEADGGNFAADVIFIAGNAGLFAEEGIRKGWMESVSDAGIPAIRSGEFPARFLRGNTAVVQIAPWAIAYNTELVKGADVPKAWKDLVNPKFKGQLIIPDPASSDAYLDLWALLLDRYGESFFAEIRANNPRRFPSGVPGTQALGAGEGAINAPVVSSQVLGLQVKGAPVAPSIPDMTTGVEIQLVLTHRAKAKHPNAGRLLAHYVISGEGNRVFNDDPGSISVYDTTQLPKQYEAPKAGTAARKEQIAKLLGFQ